MDGGIVLVGQANENVEGAHKKAIGVAPILLPNGCDDVPWEFTIGSGGAS